MASAITPSVQGLRQVAWLDCPGGGQVSSQRRAVSVRAVHPGFAGVVAVSGHGCSESAAGTQYLR